MTQVLVASFLSFVGPYSKDEGLELWQKAEV